MMLTPVCRYQSRTQHLLAVSIIALLGKGGEGSVTDIAYFQCLSWADTVKSALQIAIVCLVLRLQSVTSPVK